MATLRETLNELFIRYSDKKIDTEQLSNGLVSVVRRLPLKEQALAIDILKSLPGIGELLGDLQARNGYDFDNKAGNQLRGHAGFPSIPDDSTGYERSNADSVAMLQNLDALQDQIQMVQDGTSKSEMQKYVDALRKPAGDPNTRMRRESREPVTNRLDESKQRKRAQQELRETAVRRAALKALDRVKI
jgi:hypothetical protein